VKRSLADSARKFGPSALAGGAVTLALAAAGCSATAAAPAATQAKAAAAKASLTILPADGTRRVRPGDGVTVRATNGRVQKVVVTMAGGAGTSGASRSVVGTLSGSGTVWRSTAPLLPSKNYTVVATAVNAGGQKVTSSSSFRTLTPHKTVQMTLLESNNQSYGVGMPIVLTFNHKVTNRAAVERELSVTTSKPVIGAWRWDTAWDGTTSVAFRPRKYWSPGMQVSFTGHLNGVEIAKGVYATHDVHVSFKIGPSLIVRASTRTHFMNVYYKGKLFGHWAISTGRPGDDTPNGRYLTIEKANPTYMTGPGYALWVYWAVRFTWGGDYIHSAPWSVWAQGSTNVSHGCVNTSPAHAETFYKVELPGDPVIVSGSPRAPTWDNGWTEWFLPFSKYASGSALHQAVVAGPHGSTFVDASTVEAPAAVGPRGHGLT
jgi:lipoprotein-anchoring transpeptidase ErfK/SrfK